ncbi:MAG TPA: polyphosphate kinase 1 [Gemmatimonadaceae bacterium]|nr:polyphosphate kinase 1 [Gemmatimonadaceae bacterium]
MSDERVIRLEVRDRTTLERLITAPLPASLRERSNERTRQIVRDVYYDTPAHDLAERGVTVRHSIRADGLATLGVEMREPGAEGARVAYSRVQGDAPAVAGDTHGLFDGDSEPARLLRAMVDPARLVPQLELETTRTTRVATASHDHGRTFIIAYDLATLRLGERSSELCQVELTLPAEGGGTPEAGAITRSLESAHGVRVTLADLYRRAREIAAALETGELVEAIRGSREVVVVAHRGGRIALCRYDENALRLPGAPGAGDECCRAVMRDLFGDAQGRSQLLGAIPGTATRPALEIWFVERADASDDGDGDASSVVWLPFDQVLAMAGSPALRGARTLAALNVAARAGLSSDHALAQTLERARGEVLRPAARGNHTAPSAASPPHEEADVEAEDAGGDGLSTDTFLDRDASALAFNERVLALAADERVPLLERVRFVSIFGSNLDDFFMTRIAASKRRLARRAARGKDVAEQQARLDAMAIRVRRIVSRANRMLIDTLIPALAAQAIDLLGWSDLTEGEQQYLWSYYSTFLDAVLTPLAADATHPFPHMRNLRPALGVFGRTPGDDTRRFVAIELTGELPRFIALPGGRRFVPLEELIRAFVPALYPGIEVECASLFRVTRAADLTLDESNVLDVLQAVRQEITERPFRPVVRLEVERGIAPEMQALLLRELQEEAQGEVPMLGEQDVYVSDAFLDLAALSEIADLPVDTLHYPPLRHRSPLPADRPVTEVLREHTVLVHFPEDSFEHSVVRFLAEAADDPEVVAVKITLYRTDDSSPVVEQLLRARRAGKDVVALVELKASFEERRNIEWARSLEFAGIHVVYGAAGIKVHAKTAMVVRREDGGVRRYAYIGTGNLNAVTAATYTDLGILTADPALCADVSDVFDVLTASAHDASFRTLLVAPFNMRERFMEMIEREIAHARAGRRGAIQAKLNGLADRDIIAALYGASRAGVEIDLAVRGICALRPCVPGLSDHIRVVSLLGRFLEHSRIYRFENDGAPEYYIGSADWRHRNLSKRVEVVAPVHDAEHRRRLDQLLRDTLEHPDAWDMMPDGSYRRRGDPAAAPVNAGRALRRAAR